MHTPTPRRALICGISGQDGAYLAQLLLSKGYEVWGTSRDAQANAFHGLKTLGIFEQVQLQSMTPEDFHSVLEVFTDIRPHEIYNLAGQSSVGLSFEKPLETMASITTGSLNQLEAIRIVDKSIRFFNAGSGECFGGTGTTAADEQTTFRPESPYAVAKAAATWNVEIYRKSYGLFACTGILFNHESPLRPERFVTKKIISAARRIACGSDEELTIGNIEILRDWGWAADYVIAMWKILNADNPDDFIIATGESLTLKDFVSAAFAEAGLDWQKHVKLDPGLLRPSDPVEIKGNPTKARELLDWHPSISGVDVPKEMYRTTF